MEFKRLNIPFWETTLSVKLSEMQRRLIEKAPENHDIILLAPTGSGKTLAYALAALPGINAEKAVPQCLVLVPSRELALQGEAVVKRLKTGITPMSIIGGHATADETRRLQENSPQMIFATPGRLLDHLKRHTLDIGNVSVLIVDEFDKCLELGFREEMQSIHQYLEKETGLCRTWLCSATNNDVDFSPFIDASNALLLDFRRPKDEERTRAIVVKSPEKDKLDTLGRLLSLIAGAQTIVFVGYRESAERVGKYLKGNKFQAEIYHGGLEQRDRERALYRFSSGCSNVLVATDLAARGLDITTIKCIIHYHLPADEATWNHRNGRATRWESQGTSYLILGKEETVPAFVSHDTDGIDVSAQPIVPHSPAWVSVYVGRGKKDKISKADIVGFFCKKGGLKKNDIGLITIGDHHAFVAIHHQQVKKALQGVYGEKIKGQKTIFEQM